MSRAIGLLLLSGVLVVGVSPQAGAQIRGGGFGEETLGRTTPGLTVDPESFDITITCNESVLESLCVNIPPSGAIHAADILFLMDVTGSMGDVLAQVKAAALNIMQSITDLGIDAAFGVGSFSDYPAAYNTCGYNQVYGWNGSPFFDYAWQKNLDITVNTAAVAAAINALAIHNGQDTPENWARVLYESQFFTFRPNTVHIILAFGDSPVHDCDFYAPTSYGKDPGRDGIMNNADDLDYQTVVASLASAGTVVLALDSSVGELEPYKTQAHLNFQYMSSQTGGGYYLLADASEIPDAILGLIGEVAIIHWLSVSPVPQDPYATWATVIPPGYEDVPPNSQRCFDVVFKVPTWAPVGNYEFDLVVDADDATEATVPVVIHRTGASPTEKTTWGQIRNMFRK